jgi:hypothetical protein
MDEPSAQNSCSRAKSAGSEKVLMFAPTTSNARSETERFGAGKQNSATSKTRSDENKRSCLRESTQSQCPKGVGDF